MEKTPLVVREPRTPSKIPNSGEVIMQGMVYGKLQAFRSDMTAFVEKVNEVNKNGLAGPTGIGELKISNTNFVVSGATGPGVKERFDQPFPSIQEALDKSGPSFENWCVIVYPGVYIETLIIPAGMNLYFYPGCILMGDIILGAGCHIQFSSGCKVIGNITDAGGPCIGAEICGCVSVEGQITLSNAASFVTAEGFSIRNILLNDGTLEVHFKNLELFVSASIDQLGGTLSVYGMNLPPSAFGIFIQGGSAYFKDCNFQRKLDMDVGPTVVRVDSCNFLCLTNCINVQDGTLFVTDCSRIESTGSYAITAIAGQGEIRLRRSYVTTFNSSNENQSAIRVDVGLLLILDSNTIISKGTTGYPVEGLTPTTINMQYGNQSNADVDPINITQSISVILFDAAII